MEGKVEEGRGPLSVTTCGYADEEGKGKHCSILVSTVVKIPHLSYRNFRKLQFL